MSPKPLLNKLPLLLSNEMVIKLKEADSPTPATPLSFSGGGGNLLPPAHGNETARRRFIPLVQKYFS